MTNLYARATPTVSEVNDADHLGWIEARADLEDGLSQTDAVLAAWGVSGLSGAALRFRREQVWWLCQELSLRSLQNAWTVGGVPRHPSRWHQYVADRHARTSSGTFANRLSETLTLLPVTELRTLETVANRSRKFAGAEGVHLERSADLHAWQKPQRFR